MSHNKLGAAMANLFPKSIKSLLLIIALIISLPTVGIILYAGVQFRNNAIDEAREDTQMLADRIATEQQNLVIGGEQMLMVLAQLPDVKRHDKSKVEPILRKLIAMNPMYSNIFISDLNGMVWASAFWASPIRSEQAFSVADRSYFQKAIATGELSSGEYVVSRTLSKPAINFGRSFKDDQGNVIGVISFGFLLDKYRDLVAQMQLPKDASLALCDHKGIVLSGAIEPEKFVGKPYAPRLFQEMQKDTDDSTTIRPGIAGDKQIITIRKLRLATEQSPYMYITMGIPLEVALQQTNWALLENMASFMSFLGVALVLALLVSKYMITDRIALLEKTSKQLANGDLQIRVSEFVKGGELGSLGQSFDNMAHSIAAREQTLIESQERLSRITDSAKDAILMMDSQGRISFWNPAAEQIFGYRSDEAIGKELHSLLAPERYYAAYHAALPEFHRTGHGNAVAKTIELFAIRKDGKEIAIELSLSAVLQNNEWHAVGVTHDISKRKRAEEEKHALEQQLHQAQKMESLGILAGGIAHDFNNILAVIMCYSSLGQKEPEKAAEFMPEIEKASERAAGLCRQMLAYAGKTQFVQSKVDMTSLVDEILGMLKSTLPQNVNIKPYLSGDIPPIQGDASQLRQIAMNLIINASEAIGEVQGDVRVALTETKILEEQAEKDHQGKTIIPGSYLCLEVTDTGCGMDDETMKRIFEPFYTTKFVGRGLGMSAVLGIITSHKGALQFFSQPGRGTTFKVYLPVRIGKSTGEGSHTQGSLLPWQGSGTILLVEDEPQIKKVAKTLLESLGFSVIEASNGIEAIEQYLNYATDITMVVTDIGMPLMAGYELISELKKLDSALPIIVSSGFGDKDVISKIVPGDIAGLVSKPYNLDQLREVLKGVMVLGAH